MMTTMTTVFNNTLYLLIKMCMCDMHILKHLYDAFSVHCGLKQGDALSPLLLSMSSGNSMRTNKGFN